MHLTAQSLVDRVRQRVADEGSLIWNNTKILEACDDAMQTVTEYVRLAGSDHELDREDFLATQFTTVEAGWYELALPEWVGAIRRVEGVNSGGSEFPQLIRQAGLHDKELGRGIMDPLRGTLAPRWVRSRFGRPGSFSIFGEPSSWGKIRVFFIRRYPPLHWGTTPASGSTTSLVFAATATAGRIIQRDSLYVGMDVEITQPASPNLDQYRRITAFIGSTKTASFDAATPWPASTASQLYSLVVPLDSEHTELLIEECARRLYERSGNTQHLATLAPRLAELKERVSSSARKRDLDSPKRIWTRQI